jgi:hypothetical protein
VSKQSLEARLRDAADQLIGARHDYLRNLLLAAAASLRHGGAHCPTCQCNKFPPTPPVPENPHSRSWHE